MDGIEALARTLGRLLHAKEIDAQLIGGLALHFILQEEKRRAGASLDIDSLPLSDPRRLALMQRVTTDLDLIVPRAQLDRACVCLLEAGLQRDERVEEPPLRYRSEIGTVDIIAYADDASASQSRASRLEKMLFFLAQSGWRSDRRIAGSLPTVRPAALVLLKACSYYDRYLEKDLNDLLHLALLDLDRGEVRSELMALSPSLPDFERSSLFSLRDAFARPDGHAAGIFISALAASHPIDDALEDDIRDLLVAAVQTLLDWLEL